MIVEITEEKAQELLADENAGIYPFQLISEDGLKYVRQELAKALGVSPDDLADSQVRACADDADFQLNEGNSPGFEVRDKDGVTQYIGVPEEFYRWVIDAEVL